MEAEIVGKALGAFIGRFVNTMVQTTAVLIVLRLWGII